MEMLINSAQSYATFPEDGIRSVLGITKVLAQRLQVHENLDFVAQHDQQ